ncbi:MAG: hypothetical protein ABI220_01420 [Candidatus Saccharimonadales bacterium]
MSHYTHESNKVVDSLLITEDLKKSILNAPRGKFTSLGYVESRLDGIVLPIGIKKRGDSLRTIRELAVADCFVDSGSISLAAALPIFSIGVTYDGSAVGVLTEDFTRNNTAKLIEDRYMIPGLGLSRSSMPSEIHMDMYDALGGVVYPEAMNHTTAVVEGRAAIIDYDDIGYNDTEPLRRFFEFLMQHSDLTVRDIG